MTTIAPPDATAYISEPGKLVRILAVAHAMLDEARSAPCDLAGCEQFKTIYRRTIAELDGVISDDLRNELATLAVQFDDAAPTPSQLRIAQAELVGWLDGLMNGIVIAVQVEDDETPDHDVLIDEQHLPGQYL